jgi:hypothetical protein
MDMRDMKQVRSIFNRESSYSNRDQSRFKHWKRPVSTKQIEIRNGNVKHTERNYVKIV